MVGVMLAFAGPISSASASAWKAVDWQFFGNSEVGADAIGLFYSFTSVKRQSSGYFRVWTKGLAVKDLDAAEKQMGQALIDRTAMQLLAGFVPQIATIRKFDEDTLVGITMGEDVANNGDIAPRVRILYEIDCARDMTRALSSYIVREGKAKSDDAAGEWEHVSPESNALTLKPLVCPAG